MPETIIDGVATELPPEALADMPKSPEKENPEPVKEPEKPKEEPPKEPVKEPEKTPAKEPEAVEKPKVEDKPLPEVKPKKATPFANLLQKKHELETTLAEKEQAIADMQAKIETLSNKPDNTKTDDEIKALAEASGVDEDFISKVVTLARKGVQPNLPPEVAKLIADNQLQKDIAAEEMAFKGRVERLSKVFSDEPIKANMEKLQTLAYSDEVAPDGEKYSDKELSEIYFGFIKPEIEAPKASGERADIKGGGSHEQVVDFQEIFDRDDPRDVQKMDDKTFQDYSKWMDKKGNKTEAIVQRF